MRIASSVPEHESKMLTVGAFFPLILLCFAVFACYLNSFSNSFVSDDFYIIQLNRDTFSLHSIMKSFTSCDNLIAPHQTPYYRPLNRLTYVLEQEFFGLNPIGYHAVSISLHAISTVLLYLTLLRLRCARIPSMGAALLFAVHPVNAETVNLLAARNNILAAIFMMGSLLAFLHPAELKRSKWYIVSGFLFFCGVLSKESALMLVPLFFYLKTLRGVDVRDSGQLLKSDVSYLLPHVAFLFVYLTLRFVALDYAYSLSGLSQRLWKLVYILPKYLSLTVIPLDLTFSHSVPDNLAPLTWPLIAGWAVIAASAYYVVRVRTAAFEFGLAWLVVNLIPICNIVPIPSAPMAERYLYVPLAGLIMIVADRFHHLTERPTTKRLAFVAVVCLVIYFGLLTSKRNDDWKDEIAFAAGLVRSNPSDAQNHYELGYQYFLHGDLKSAHHELERSIMLDPAHSEACRTFYYLAVLCLEQHDAEQARRYLIKAEHADNGKPMVHYLLGALYAQDKRMKESAEENELFLKFAMADSSQLIPEANNRLLEAKGAAFNAAKTEALQLPGNWKLYQRFSTGTELYYEPATIERNGDTRTVSTRHILGRKDIFPYALKFIKFPLTKTAEVRYKFEMKCSQQLYKTFWCEFRDKDGKLLGESDTEKEDYVKYVYPLPGSPMHVLFREVCDG